LLDENVLVTWDDEDDDNDEDCCWLCGGSVDDETGLTAYGFSLTAEFLFLSPYDDGDDGKLESILLSSKSMLYNASTSCENQQH
jgi:hypothetical protein